MTDIEGTPFVWFNFNKDGRLIDNPEPLEALLRAVATTAATDVLVLAHGWKNEQSHALKLYTDIWKHTRGHLPKSGQWVIVGISWPSVAFPKDFDDNAVESSAGGALSASEGDTPEDLDERTFREIVDNALPGEVNRKLRQAALATGDDPSPESKTAFAQEFSRRLRTVGPTDTQGREQNEELDVPTADGEVEAEISIIAGEVENDPELLFGVSFQPFVPADGGGASSADTFNRSFKGPRATIARIANQFTYYPMKRRAGTVGRMLGAYLDPQPALAGLRLHLVGHSFGGRVVTACASQMKALNPNNLILLQAAFSQNGFVAAPPAKRGYFADVLEKQHKQGPTTIAVTHTHNDRACAFFYPLASRLSGDGKSSFGGAEDPYGAMGANGAQSVGAITHEGFPDGTRNSPQKGKVNNYLADSIIVAVPGGPDAHNNIATGGIGRMIGRVISA